MYILQSLGIYSDAITETVKLCRNALEEAGFTRSEIEDMDDMAREELRECGTFDDITNSILDAYLHVTTDLLNERYEGINFSYYVNCHDTHLSVEVENSEFGSQEYYDGEIEKAIKEAAWVDAMEYVYDVVDSCEEAMREAGLSENEIAEMHHEAKEQYDRTASTEPDLTDVAEAFLYETVGWLESVAEGKGVAFDYTVDGDDMLLLVNGEPYEEGSLKKALEQAHKAEKSQQERD